MLLLRSVKVRWWLALALSLACEREPAENPAHWQLVQSQLPGALLSIWGTGVDDVWAVGADARDGTGPVVVHFDGTSWKRENTGLVQGDLWWVFGFEDGPIYMGGAGGVIVRRTGDTYEVMDTPGTGTVYGIWGADPSDVWAVGGDSDNSGGFAWRLRGGTWAAEATLPTNVPTDAALWKAFGSSIDDLWIVGSNGVSLRWDGTTLQQGDTGVGSSLFTVYEYDGLYAAVGGLASGIIVESNDGIAWNNVTPEPPPLGLAGVSLGADGVGIAVGFDGAVYRRGDDGWGPDDPGLLVRENLHGTWIDDEGGLWAAGGQTLTAPFTDGVLLRYGTEVPTGGL